MDPSASAVPALPVAAPPALDLSKVKLPPWMGELAENLMHTAEGMFGPGSGADKKAWVRNALLDAARKVDVKAIPDWIENPAKAALVDLMIDILWSSLYGAEKRRQLRAARQLRKVKALRASQRPLPPHLAHLAQLGAPVVDILDDDLDDGDIVDGDA